MRAKRRVLWLAVAGVAVGLFFFLRGADVPTSLADDGGLQARSRGGSRAEPGELSPTTPGATSARRVERMDAETRARVVAAIALRLAESSTAADASVRAARQSGWLSQEVGAAKPTSPDDAQLNREYIRDRVREIIPLIRECYDLARRQEPGLGGALLTASFTIEGATDLGGVITESDVSTPDGGARSPALEECVRETMYALRFAAPPGGGTVKVRYPFRFSNEEQPTTK